MPEGDTIFRAARTLQRALAGQVVTGFESVLPKLERVEVDSRVTGRTVEKVEANGKWMLIYFSGNLILLTHMLMSGNWHIYRPGEKWKRRVDDMRIVIRTERIQAVAFTVPIAEFHTPDSLRRRDVFNKLGPSVLTAEYDDGEILRRLRDSPEISVGEALLKQSLLAGIGNVFKSEICFSCMVNPFRALGMLSISELSCLVSTARKFLMANVKDSSGSQIVTYTGFRRTTNRTDREESLWVYKRTGKPCRRCGTPIESRKQGFDARITFWCPNCQPLDRSVVRRSHDDLC
ncbi:MAG: Fpg/Nei family DNA glycosylase [Candidatus Acidiferrum sp.]